MTEVYRNIEEWVRLRRGPLFSGKSVGFVPTMGFLHEGHLSLFRKSLSENAITIGSIFVNPTQFNNPEDFNKYPQNFEKDLEMLNALGVDYLLNPTYSEIYPDNYRYKVVEAQVSQELCGQHRPGHFDGVLTVVMKLFNLVAPTKAYFGEKDYQQLLLVKEMVSAFFMPTEVIACPTVREQSGLAMSSRNERLSEDEKKVAAEFARILKTSVNNKGIETELNNMGIKVDYVQEKWGRRFGAVHVGDVRLIDNVKV